MAAPFLGRGVQSVAGSARHSHSAVGGPLMAAQTALGRRSSEPPPRVRPTLEAAWRIQEAMAWRETAGQRYRNTLV